MDTKEQGNNEFVIIGLTNPKSPSNVGAVMRAAGCYSVNEVYYTGKRYAQAAKYSGDKLNTDTKNARQSISLCGVEQLTDIISQNLWHNTTENSVSLAHDQNNELKIVCVDLVEGAIPLPLFKHPEKALYIFGPEDGTISQKVIDQADSVVYVPTKGCMNLAATVNVLLYDRLAKSTHMIKENGMSESLGDELIRKSRDTNNSVKVKKASA